MVIFTLSSCQQDKVVKRTTTLYAYEVNEAVESYSKGVLRYMEAEYYENDRIISKTFYNNDQTVKGIEKYNYQDRDSLPDSSEYFDADGNLSATYKFTNQDGHQVQRDGYEGDTGILLRQERYQYDPQGNRVKKIIFDGYSKIQRTFLFAHDKYGNETEMNILNEKDQLVIKEEYEISLIDDDNKWVEKWGYVGDQKTPKTFYQQSY